MVSIYIWLLLTCQCGYKCMRARACVCCVCLLPANGKVFSSLLYVIAFALLLFHLALPFPLPFSQQAHCLPTISQTISLSIYSYFFSTHPPSPNNEIQTNHILCKTNLSNWRSVVKISITVLVGIDHESCTNKDVNQYFVFATFI